MAFGSNHLASSSRLRTTGIRSCSFAIASFAGVVMIVQVSTPARVLVDIGPFRFLEIYELDGEFLGFYRDEKE